MRGETVLDIALTAVLVGFAVLLFAAALFLLRVAGVPFWCGS